MNLAVRNQHILALVILAVVSLLLFSAVAHVDLWHLFGIGKFAWKYPG